MADTGYISVASAVGTDQYQHTTATKLFYHDGAWWGLLRNGSSWDIYKRTGSAPATPGDTGGWTSHLTGIATTGQAAICCDSANNKAYAIGFQPGGATVSFKALSYSAGSWSLVGGSNGTFNLCNTSGVGLGTTSTFENHTHLSIGVDTNGVPLVVAGNAGASVDAVAGVHIAHPDNASALGGTWSIYTIDTDVNNIGDYAGMYSGTFSQGGTNYICVSYCTDSATNRHKLAYCPVQTTMSEYHNASNWTKETIDATVSCDNHLHGMIATVGSDTIVFTTGKDANSRIYLFTSKLGASLTWTHKRHRVTNGSADGANAEAASRGTVFVDTENGEVYAFGHENQSNPEGRIFYKKVAVADLLASSSETDTFDTSGVYTGATTVIDDESVDRAKDSHSAGHPITSAMSPVPVIAQMVGTAQWWNEITITAAQTFQELAGTVAAQSTYTATLNVVEGVFGSVSGQAAFTGDITVEHVPIALAGAITGQSAFAATLNLTETFAGSIAAQATFTATLTGNVVAVELEGAIAAQFTLGELTIETESNSWAGISAGAEAWTTASAGAEIWTVQTAGSEGWTVQ